MSFLTHLEKIIDDRVTDNSADSYVAKLAQSGLDRVLKKIGEEAGEVIIGAKNNSRNEVIFESADLIFHLLIVLRMLNISLKDIENELESRHYKHNK